MQDFFGIHFLYPYILFGILLIFPIIFLLYFSYKKIIGKINFFGDLTKIFGKFNFLFYFQILIISLIFSIFIIILANPQKINIDEKIKKNGIDIVFALDISKSMDADDINPTRLEKAKILLENFIKKQKTNRAGLVIFAGKPVSAIPLTFDYNILIETIKNLSTDTISGENYLLNGTAVGDALLISEKMLKKDNNKKREKVIILLTDGDSNKGINPILVASKILKKENIKVYTIGIGSKQGGTIKAKIGNFIIPQKIPPLNEKTLQKISDLTLGKFFRAKDTKSFEEIFKTLEKLEKNDIEVKEKKLYSDYYKIFWIFLLGLLTLLFILELRKT